MRPNLRHFRVGWTVFCATVAVLLVVLWVRSYLRLGSIQPWGHDLLIANGSVLVDETWVPTSEPPIVSTNSEPDGTDGFHVSTTTITMEQPAGTGLRVPLWLPAAAFVLAAIAPWVGRQFSLRTLLVAITAVAVVLGVVVWSLK